MQAASDCIAAFMLQVFEDVWQEFHIARTSNKVASFPLLTHLTDLPVDASGLVTECYATHMHAQLRSVDTFEAGDRG